MTDEQYTENRKLVIAVVLAILGGNVGTLLNKTTPDVRNDPFTGTEARQMVDQLQFRIEQCEARIRKDMPPEPTRKKIRDIEIWLERTTDFKVKEYHW